MKVESVVLFLAAVEANYGIYVLQLNKEIQLTDDELKV